MIKNDYVIEKLLKRKISLRMEKEIMINQQLMEPKFNESVVG
jgi:hypothetical protein